MTWRYVWNADRQLWDKPPVRATTGKAASSTNPKSWTTFETALRAYEQRDLDGLGFVVTETNCLVGVDLDHCRDPDTGTIAPWAQAIVDRLATYTEVSPSGTGLRLFHAGTLPPGGRKKGDIEMYSSGRYLTITGNRLRGTPLTIEAHQAALDAMHAEVFAAETAPEAEAPHAETNGHAPPLEDDALPEKALAARNGEKFGRLRRGDTTGYRSRSEADLALCSLLAFWTRDTAQLDRLFRRSQLMRDKWDERHGEATYGELTITKAWRRAVSADQLGRGQRPQADQTPYSDQYNAEAFGAAHGAALRYCERWKAWLVWDGWRWVVDEQGQVMRWAKATIKALADRWIDMANGEDAKAFQLHVRRSLSLRSLEAMVRLAQSEPGIAVTPEAFDRDPWLFNVQNGTLDLRTGELRPHRRDDLLMKLSPVAYDDEATCPQWETFLRDIYAGDLELIAFDQKATGYTLTGETREQVVLICHGAGSNGKSTKLSIMRELMGEGEYALRTNLKAFTESTAHHQPASIEYYIAKLQHVRFAYASEGEEGARLSEALIKDVTGGVDFIAGRHPYGSPFSFRPRFKLWLATNHEPVIRGTEPAIWWRPRKIPFTVSFEGREDKELFAKLCQELPGILRWAVKGCLRWQIGGLEPPTAVKDATAAYRRSMDVVGRFIEEQVDAMTDRAFEAFATSWRAAAVSAP